MRLNHYTTLRAANPSKPLIIRDQYNRPMVSCWDCLILNYGRLVTHRGWVARHVRYDPVRLRTRKPCWLRMRAAL